MTIGSAIRAALARALVASGVAGLLVNLFWRHRVAILVYHDPDPDTLDHHLAYLKTRCRIISLDTLTSAMGSSGGLAALGRSAVVTVDDGHAGNARLADVFQKHDVRPTIYLCSQIVGTTRQFWWQHPEAARQNVERLKSMPNAERLRRLGEGGFVEDAETGTHSALRADELGSLGSVADYQSHTRFHPILTKCDDARCRAEIEGSRREIETLSGAPCVHFAYPNGDYGVREMALLKSAGYRSARTCDLGWIDDSSDLMALRAIPIADDASLDWFAVQLTGLPTYLRYLRHGSFSGRSPQS